LMSLLDVIPVHIDISPHHIHRLMPEDTLQRKYIRAILYGHLRESMAESMGRTSDVIYAGHAPVLGDPATNAVPIHLLVVMRNKKPIDRRMSARFQISLEQAFGLRLNRYEPIFAVLSRDKYLIILRPNIVYANIA